MRLRHTLTEETVALSACRVSSQDNVERASPQIGTSPRINSRRGVSCQTHPAATHDSAASPLVCAAGPAAPGGLPVPREACSPRSSTSPHHAALSISRVRAVILVAQAVQASRFSLS